MKPVIFGLAGPQLSPDESALFRDADPAGYILFARNIVNHDQLRALTDSLRALAGRDDLAILIDQEGGRVARLRPPEWEAFPPGSAFDALYDVAPMSAIEAIRANAEAIALTLAALGISVDCLPLLDVRQPGAHDIIGDRALGSEPLRVAALGRATLDGLSAGGVVGVVKHMPGHGRALADSHLELPIVDADTDALETDLAPFIALARAPMAMTAHVIYRAWDADHCASLSAKIIGEIIRKRIGFDGLLMSDDIDMKALSGAPGEKARAVVAAGCDLALDCWGRFDEMVEIAAALDEINPASRARLDAAMARRATPDFSRRAALIAKRDALLAYSV